MGRTVVCMSPTDGRVGAGRLTRSGGLSYEDLDLIDDQLLDDPGMGVGGTGASGRDAVALAGKSTLNRLELSQAEPTR